MQGSKEGELQQSPREALAQGQHKGSLRPKELLRGTTQALVQPAVSLHEVWSLPGCLQEPLHLRDTQERGEAHSGMGYERGELHSRMGYERGQAHSREGYDRGEAHSIVGYKRGEPHSRMCMGPAGISAVPTSLC